MSKFKLRRKGSFQRDSSYVEKFDTILTIIPNLVGIRVVATTIYILCLIR